MENKFYKVAQEGGSYVVAYFFNPVTKEEKSCCVRDYDYFDCSRDKDELYYMAIDENVRKIYMHFHGIILVGDTVEIVRGRKIPHGTVAKVVKIYDWRDCYGRTQATYAVFEDGRKTNINNCKLLAG